MSPRQIFFHFPSWDALLPRAGRMNQRLLVSPRKTQAKWGERNCPSFETALVELNHHRQSGALTIRPPPLSISRRNQSYLTKPPTASLRQQCGTTGFFLATFGVVWFAWLWVARIDDAKTLDAADVAPSDNDKIYKTLTCINSCVLL